MTGVVTGGMFFVWACFGLTALVFAGLTLWTVSKLNTARRRLAMLEKGSTDQA